ncbi:MAG: MFS transporter [Candidatus Goldbacteria bacterium]|nr:MFS transporter [Candidatus Goldiibacteriota bacterium]
MEKQIRLNRLIGITVLFTIAVVLSDVFVNIYIWRLKNNYASLSLYMLSTYAVVPFIFYANGFIARKLDRVSIYRIGIIFYAAFYLCVLVLNQKVTDYLILLGVLKGLAMGFYWFGYHVLTFDYTSPQNRDRFYSITSVASGITSLLAPPVAGYMIVKLGGYTGYYFIFITSALLFISAILMSSSLKSEPVDHPYKIKDLIFTRDKKWRGVLIAYFFLAARDAITMFLFAVLLVKVTDSEFTFGRITILFSAVSITTAYLLGKISKPVHREKLILYGAIIQFAASLVLLVKIDFIFLVIQGLLFPIGDNLIRIPISAYSMDVISESDPEGKRKMEYLVARDLPIAAGRISMMLFFMFLLQHLPVYGIKATIFIISLAPFGIWLALKNTKVKPSKLPPITVSEA